MKLLLIGPSRYKDDGAILRRKWIPFPRLNLLHLAALTPKGIQVDVIDELVEEIDFGAECDLVAITTFTSQAPRAYDIADRFRGMGKKVIMGGIHVSSIPEEAKRHTDSIVLGEADYLWRGIIEDFRNNALKPLYQSTQFHDLRRLPTPRYDLVKKRYYLASTMPVQASRGCPHNCDFCTVTRFFGGSYRFRPVDDVVRDIKATGSRRIFFVDDNIIANREYAKELFTRLIPLKIRWSGQSTINLGNFPDLCKLAAESGCFFLCIGVESINQASLNHVGKKHNKVQEYYRLLRAMRENGLSVQLSMIVGFDGDDENIFDETIKFVSDIKPFLTSINVPIPYPGTRLTNRLEVENRILHRDWSKYRVGKVVFSPRLLSKEQLETQALSAYKRLYTFKSIIVRSLSQPRRNIIRSFVTNLIGRKFVYKGEWLNAG